MSFSGGRDRLVPKALELKKAWLLLIVGTGRPLSRQNATIPAYGTWTRKELEAHYRHLLDDLQEVLAVYVVSPRAALRTRATGWLAEQFDRWQAKGGGPFTISTVQQFEARVGTILARERLELPPYAEVLLQPGVSLAFRHPEYMLVRDLGLLVDHGGKNQLVFPVEQASLPLTFVGTIAKRRRRQNRMFCQPL